MLLRHTKNILNAEIAEERRGLQSVAGALCGPARPLRSKCFVDRNGPFRRLDTPRCEIPHVLKKR